MFLLFLLFPLIICVAGNYGTEIKNITYTTVGGTPLTMDIYQPPDMKPTDKLSCLLQIHGGGWSGGDKEPVPQDVLSAGLQNNMILSTINYRLTSQTGMYGDENVTFPAQINDVRNAVKFLKQNADKYQIDISKIGCWGQSAGNSVISFYCIKLKF